MRPGCLAAVLAVAVFLAGPAKGIEPVPAEPAADEQEAGNPVDQAADGQLPPLADIPALPNKPAEKPASPPADPSGTAAADLAGPPLAHEEPARPRTAAPAVRCRIKLDVAGELVVPAGSDVPPIRRPIGLDARFDFEERPIGGESPARATRLYTDAVASITVGDETEVTSLAADARKVLVVRRGAAASPCLENAFLTSDERGLLEIPFDPLLLDEMLPGQPMPVGATWEMPADLAAGLLSIDTVESGKVEARLEEVANGRSRVVLSGTVEGGVDGVPTRVDVSGSFSTSAREAEASVGLDGPRDAADEAGQERHELLAPVGNVSVVMRERRQAGHVAPGFDVEARLQVARKTVESGEDGNGSQVADTAQKASRRRGDGTTGRIWQRDADGRFDLVHDARWRLVEKGPSGVVMRLVDRGALVGQCSISATARPESGFAAPSVADVQRDIERSLAGEGARVDEAAAEDRADGMRVVRVASSGTAAGLPFRWIHYVLAAEGRSRVDVAFMVQESMRDRFADADRELVASLAVPEDGGPRAMATDSAAGPAPVREARETDEAASTPLGRL